MARRFGRRRKPRVVWLPPTGQQINGGLTAGEQYSGGFFVGKVVLGGNHNPTISFPLVTDNPSPNLSQALSVWRSGALTEDLEFGYRLRRIVGKIHVGTQHDETSNPSTRSNFISVTAGIIVRRVDDIGNAVATDVSTQDIQNNRDPWIWRRNWLLGTQHFLLDPDPMSSFNLLPTNNVTAYGGGNHDAAHLDQKTARRVGPEERLFLDVSLVSGLQLVGQDEADETINFACHYDMRFLASPYTAAGNRRNASR